MQTAGKFDCTRSPGPILRWPAHILLTVIFLLLAASMAAAQATPLPELARLGRSTYCNPYFGFRLTLPADFRAHPMTLPVPSPGRHVLAAWKLERLDRDAELLISAYEDRAENAARLAARARQRQAQQKGLFAQGPQAVSLAGRTLYRLRLGGDPLGGLSETSYFWERDGWVVHLTIASHNKDLAGVLEASLERLGGLSQGEGCGDADGRAYYGPALSSAQVEGIIHASPRQQVPVGSFANGAFRDPEMGIALKLPEGWRPLPSGESDRVTALLRDPLGERDRSDRRRALFRACASELFAAVDSQREIAAGVHPGLALLALPMGCVPDLIPPPPGEAAEAFAEVLMRSLGSTQLSRVRQESDAAGGARLSLEGTLPYREAGEELARRLSLHVTVLPQGRWLVLFVSALPGAGEARELESHMQLANTASEASR